MVLVDISSIFASVISVSDGPYTINIRTPAPLQFNFPVTHNTDNTGYVSGLVPLTSAVTYVLNDSSYYGKIYYLRGYIPVNPVGAFLFSGYPSGSSFTHSFISKSYISDSAVVSCASVANNSVSFLLYYDILFYTTSIIPTIVLDCGFTDDVSIVFPCDSSLSVASVVLGYNFPSFVTESSTAIPVTGTYSNILSAMNTSLNSLNSKVSLTNDDLEQLVTLTTATNNLLNLINGHVVDGMGEISTQLNGINTDMNTFKVTMQTEINELETSLLKSLSLINSQLVLIKNGLLTFRNNEMRSFLNLVSLLTGSWPDDAVISSDDKVTLDINATVSRMKTYWAEIIAMGLDNVAPDTSDLSNEQESASQQLADIGNSDIIKNIGNTTDSNSALNSGLTGFFNKFGTKVLIYNNLLQKVYDSLGDVTYVILATMAVGLLGFFFRVGNTFIRGSSGGGGKSINLPKKLK